MKLVTYTDGGARGNPGPAGIGVVIMDESGKEVLAFGEAIGDMTNNQAEYRALLRAMSEAQALGAEEVTCHLDSELVVRQLTGQYKVKEPGLQLLAAEILKLTSKFKNVAYRHVPREKNARADALVNEALDKAGK